MVIGEFNESYPPLMDGVGQVVRNYTHELRSLGDEVYAITAGDKESMQYDREHGESATIRARMISLPVCKPYGPVIMTAHFKNRVKGINFDIIHSHSPFYFGAFARRMAKKHKAVHITTFHSQFKDDIEGAIKIKFIANAFFKRVMKHYDLVDEVWVPSAATALKLKEYGYKGDIIVMENGCDMTIPTEEEYIDKRRRALEYLGIEDCDRPILLYIGQHKNEKNLEMLLKSLEILNSSGFPFLMIFVGIGPDKHSYENYVRKHGIPAVFLGKVTDRSILESLYAVSDLFLFPSLYDTSCLVMREAATFKTPVLFVNGSCTSEYVEDGVNGFKADNLPQAYADRIRDIFSDSDTLSRVCLEARRTLYRSWHDVAEDVRRQYEIALKKYGKAR